MSEHFKTFSNGDLGMRYEKYLEDGKIELENIRVNKLDEDTFALDIFWGEDAIENDTYLYPTAKEAALDGLELHILSLRKTFEENHQEALETL